MQSGTRLKALNRVGTARLGFRQIPALSMKLQAAANVISSAIPTTPGANQLRPALQIHRNLTASVFQTTHIGTPQHASTRHGAEQNGFRQQAAAIMKPPARLSAASSATKAISGTAQNASIRVMPHHATTSHTRQASALRSA